MLGVVDDGDEAVLLVACARISSVPIALVPLPNHVARMSSSARVLPGSIETVVDFALSPSGVKVSWYFCTCGAVLVMRTSDWKLELMPPAWATAGMISASGGGVFFDPGETGCTRLTFTVVDDDVAFAPVLLDEPKRTEIAAVLVPTGRPSVFAVTVSTSVSEVVTPLAGVTVTHGSFAVAENGWPGCVGIVSV